MNQPWRHRPGLDPNPGIISRVPSDYLCDMPRVGCTLATPKAACRCRQQRRSKSTSVKRPIQQIGSLNRLPCANRRATVPGSQHYESCTLRTAITRCPHMSLKFPPLRSRVLGCRHAHRDGVSLLGRASFLRPGHRHRGRRAQPGSSLAAGHRRSRRAAGLTQASTTAA